LAADNILEIGYLHAPLFQSQLQRQIVGTAVVENIDSLPSQIIGAANIGSNYKSIGELIVRSGDDLNIRSPDGGRQRSGRRPSREMRAVSQKRGDGPCGARDHDDFDIQPMLIEDL